MLLCFDTSRRLIMRTPLGNFKRIPQVHGHPTDFKQICGSSPSECHGGIH